jgi:uncharacterized membrane protein
VIPYMVTAVSFIVIDLLWLGVVAKSFYRRELGSLMLEKINLPVALIFYLIFPMGLTIFAVAPALGGGGVGYALQYGALFGFFAYATYDLTNLATLKNWSTKLSIIDIAWGTALASICAGIGAALGAR